MSKYSMEDGTVVDTEKASQSWDEDTRWDGRNHISVPTGSQWDHERLHRSRKGRYYLECWSQYQGSRPHAEWVSEHEATKWLMANDHEETIPNDLKHLVDEVSE